MSDICGCGNTEHEGCDIIAAQAAEIVAFCTGEQP